MLGTLYPIEHSFSFFIPYLSLILLNDHLDKKWCILLPNQYAWKTIISKATCLMEGFCKIEHEVWVLINMFVYLLLLEHGFSHTWLRIMDLMLDSQTISVCFMVNFTVRIGEPCWTVEIYSEMFFCPLTNHRQHSNHKVTNVASHWTSAHSWINFNCLQFSDFLITILN